MYDAAPVAALESPPFYELLALADMPRGDFRAQERTLAVNRLRHYLAGEE